MANAVVIVQARMTSSRLPGKVLAEVAGRSVLDHVKERCDSIPGNALTCFAVPEGAGQQPLIDELDWLGARVVRGSEEDVLGRYLLAAQAVGADVIMRVTSDCPLIDPRICGDVLRLVVSGAADYACNNMPRGWPHGLDCEAFTMEALAVANSEAREPQDREHVTPWLRRHPSLRRVNLTGPGGELPNLRWTLDYPEDLDFMRALADVAPNSVLPLHADDLLMLCRRHPAIVALNAMRHEAAVSQPRLKR